MYFIKKHERTGKLFEGVFRATHANNDSYLEYLFVYIHLNPVKMIEPKWKERGISNTNTAKQFLENYYYSSYLDYSKNGIKREERIIIDKKNFPEYFEDFKEFNSFIFPRAALGNKIEGTF